MTPYKIKITEEQMNAYIEESIPYIVSSIPQEPKGQNFAAGKVNDKPSDPTTADEIGRVLTPQPFGTLRSGAGGMGRICEEDNKEDYTTDNPRELDSLSNDDKDDDPYTMPSSVQAKADALIDSINSLNINSKQVAMILNKIIERLGPKMSSSSNAFVRGLVKSVYDAAQ